MTPPSLTGIGRADVVGRPASRGPRPRRAAVVPVVRGHRCGRVRGGAAGGAPAAARRRHARCARVGSAVGAARGRERCQPGGADVHGVVDGDSAGRPADDAAQVVRARRGEQPRAARAAALPCSARDSSAVSARCGRLDLERRQRRGRRAAVHRAARAPCPIRSRPRSARRPRAARGRRRPRSTSTAGGVVAGSPATGSLASSPVRAASSRAASRWRASSDRVAITAGSARRASRSGSSSSGGAPSSHPASARSIRAPAIRFRSHRAAQPSQARCHA